MSVKRTGLLTCSFFCKVCLTFYAKHTILKMQSALVKIMQLMQEERIYENENKRVA